MRSTRHITLAAALLGAAWLQAGCDNAISQLVLVVESDLAVPGELDAVRVEAKRDDDVMASATAALAGPDAEALPRYITLVDRGGDTRAVDITVTGLLDAQTVVTRRASVRFVEGEIRVLRIRLVFACKGVDCPAEQTCAVQGCRDIAVDPSELEPWMGEGALLDGGSVCTPNGEQCNGRDDDCDGTVDEGFDLQTDPRNCGRCGVPCSDGLPNVMEASCTAGSCNLRCVEGFYDCDGQPINGCESQLRDSKNCGACGTPCTLTRANEADCSTGVCVPLTCEEGYADCDGTASNGCEAQIGSLQHCGGCGIPCSLSNAVESCGSGTCSIVSCETGFDNCDGRNENGCEVDISQHVDHCGGCNDACPLDVPNGASSCNGGNCEVICDAGWADCNGQASDGCEADLSSATSCGSCGVQCSGAAPLCQQISTGYQCTDGCSLTTCGTSCVDTTSDPRHCGGCNNACPAPNHASPTCSSSTCGFVCDAGWGDCNGDPRDGCEASLTSLTHCGSCNSACSRSGATATCATGTCQIAQCSAGFADCDGVDSNGCEVTLGTTSNCSGCGDTCNLDRASATCSGGSCQIAECDSGWGNCDGVQSNGCETSLQTLQNCTQCGTVCSTVHATQQCQSTGCDIISCESGWADCNGVASDGCETSLTTNTSCGSCGSACSAANALTTCTSGTCELVSCDAGWDDCNNSSSDGCETSVDNDANNCGACGNVCADGAPCVNSTCGCPAGKADCDGDPATGCEVDLNTADRHCGICNNVCQRPERCCNGACERPPTSCQ